MSLSNSEAELANKRSLMASLNPLDAALKIDRSLARPFTQMCILIGISIAFNQI